MIRKIIEIDKEKCNGCGLCAHACHEGAIGMVDGKASSAPRRLLRRPRQLPAGLPDRRHLVRRARSRRLRRSGRAGQSCRQNLSRTPDARAAWHGVWNAPRSISRPRSFRCASQLRQWPVQIKLVPVNAPYFDGASLLIAADCTAYAYANFHQDFIRGKVTLVGCPKLDDVDYSEKLTEILRQNNIKSVTVVRMEVPCCGGLEYAVSTALQNCGKLLPWQVKTISIKGELLDD